MCRPYDRNPQYYYPARPFMVASHLNALILSPVVFAPDCADSFFLARLYFLPVALLHFTMMLFSYFGSVMQWKRWHKTVWIVSIPIVVALLAAFCVAVWPGDWMDQGKMPLVGDIVSYGLGLVMTVGSMAAIWMVQKWTALQDEDEFSNKADFPVRQARLWTMVIALNLLFCWTGALSGSQIVLSVVMLLLALIGVLVLISALHPHRTKRMEMVVETAESDSPEESIAPVVRGLSVKRRKEILAAIRAVVEEQNGCLDAHLTLQDVADRSGYNRSYVSTIIKEEFGGFFVYVNHLRLAHVEAYLQQHASATLQEAVLESGFNSRQAYYSVKKKIS
ncbi:MAG: helix-turn-helix transcriptional regulator [Bacteroidales bacterium]|nr:helix-turn-helix transcriptional regulator [Bacteroidales bacterium]